MESKVSFPLKSKPDEESLGNQNLCIKTDHKHQNKGGIWSLEEGFERYSADKFIQIHVKS